MKNIVILLCSYLLLCSFGYRDKKIPNYKGKVKTVTESRPYFSKRNLQIITRNFDNKGRILAKTERHIKKRRNRTVDKIHFEEKYLYDDKGRLIKTISRYPENVDKVYSETEYMYDNEGNQTKLISRAFYPLYDTVYIRHREWRKYNAYAQLIELKATYPSKKILPDSDTTRYSLHRYEYSGDSIVLQKAYSNLENDFHLIKKSKYNAKGRLLEEIEYYRDKPRTITTYKYNEEGNIIRHRRKDRNSTGASIVTYKYEEPDSMGNYTKLLTKDNPNRKPVTTTFLFEYHD